MTDVVDSRDTVCALAVSRSRAFVRGLTWLVPAAILGTLTVSVYGGLEFVPTAVSNRLVEYSIAIMALPLPAGTAWAAFRALRWLALAWWPGRLAIDAGANGLVFHLGPFGTRTFDAARLNVRYPFELTDDEEDATFESFLPEEEQLRALLPRITHPAANGPLNRIILAFSNGDEAQAAAALRPAIEAWRSAAS